MSWLKSLLGIEDRLSNYVESNLNDSLESNYSNRDIETHTDGNETSTIIRYFDGNEISGVSLFAEGKDYAVTMHFDGDGNIIDGDSDSNSKFNAVTGYAIENGNISYDSNSDSIKVSFGNGHGGTVEKEITNISQISKGGFFNTGEGYRMVGCTEEQKADILERLTISGGDLEPKSFVHTGPNKIDVACLGSTYFRDSDCTNRPDVGGFWGSISDNPRESISQWNDFAVGEGLDKKRSEFVTTFSISPDSRVLYISNESDLSDLAKAFPGTKDMTIAVNTNDGYIFDRDSCLSVSIDWNAVSEKYDVYVADSNFYRYDIDFNVVVFNPDVVNIESSMELGDYIKENDMVGDWKDYTPSDGTTWNNDSQFREFIDEKFDGYNVEGIYTSSGFYHDRYGEITPVEKNLSDGHVKEIYTSYGNRLEIEYTDSSKTQICEINSFSGPDSRDAHRTLIYNEDKELVKSIYSGASVDYHKNGETATIYRIETITEYKDGAKTVTEKYFSTDCNVSKGSIKEQGQETLYKTVVKEYNDGGDKERVEVISYDKESDTFSSRTETYQNGSIDKVEIIEKTGEEITFRTEFYEDDKLSKVEITQREESDYGLNVKEDGLLQVGNTNEYCDKIVLNYQDGELTNIEYQTRTPDGAYETQYTEEIVEVTEGGDCEGVLCDKDGAIVEVREIDQGDLGFVTDTDAPDTIASENPIDDDLENDEDLSVDAKC